MKKLFQNEVSEHFYYCSDSPSGLRWKTDRYGGFLNRTLNAEKDSLAGSIGKQGYWMVYCKWIKANRACHRIVWTLVFGNIPDGMEVDHIDGDRGNNNKIENLRLVTDKGNSRNQKLRKDNKTGVKGVHLHVSTSGFVSYMAQWTDEHGVKRCRYFSVSKWGESEALRLAQEARLSAIKKVSSLCLEEAYTERHLQEV